VTFAGFSVPFFDRGQHLGLEPGTPIPHRRTGCKQTTVVSSWEDDHVERSLSGLWMDVQNFDSSQTVGPTFCFEKTTTRSRKLPLTLAPLELVVHRILVPCEGANLAVAKKCCAGANAN
jgi:hypothetical protein